MDHDEFLEVVEKCREQRGALTIVREAGRLLEKPPLAFGTLEKMIQDWGKPTPIDRAVRLAIQVLDAEGASANVARAREFLSALLLAAGERAAEHERRTTSGAGKTKS